MRFKKGVKIHGAGTETLLAMQVAEQVYRDIYDRTMVVTSVRDGKHRVGSKHYDGDAFDSRIWYVDDYGKRTFMDSEVIAYELRERLTDEYDVIVHSTHIHVEYDPEEEEE